MSSLQSETPRPLKQLTVEREVFEKNYQTLVSEHLDEVVLIYGKNILGFYDSLPMAEEAAYRDHHLLGKAFLLRRIVSPKDEDREEIYQRLNLADLK
jgi:hypothetical protein